VLICSEPFFPIFEAMLQPLPDSSTAASSADTTADVSGGPDRAASPEVTPASGADALRLSDLGVDARLAKSMESHPADGSSALPSLPKVAGPSATTAGNPRPTVLQAAAAAADPPPPAPALPRTSPLPWAKKAPSLCLRHVLTFEGELAMLQLCDFAGRLWTRLERPTD